MILPGTDLLADVEHQRRGTVAWVLKPDPASPLPYIHATVGLESDSDSVSPRSWDGAFSKSGRHRRRREITLKDKTPRHSHQARDRDDPPQVVCADYKKTI